MKFRRLTFIAGLCVLGWLPFRAEASILTPFAPEKVSIGGRVTVEVRLDSQGETVNAVEAGLRYDPDTFSLISLSTGGSFLTLWPEPPAETALGTIVASGGVPIGTISDGGRVFSATFLARRAGQTEVVVLSDRSGVYVSDGFGTPTNLEVKSLRLVVEPFDPFTPRLMSSTHPLPAVWSAARTFRVSWDILPSTVVSYRLGRDPLKEPDDFADENLGVVEYPNLEDGLWYFTFKMRLSGEDWGPVASWPVWIDGTPPDPFRLDLLEIDGQRLLSYAPYDATSGIHGVSALIERSRWWKPWSRSFEVRSTGGQLILDDIRSVRRVYVTAYDTAGNPRTAVWISPRFADGSRLLVLMALAVTVVLASILLLIILDLHPAKPRLARRRKVR